MAVTVHFLTGINQFAIPSTSGMAISQEGSIPQQCICRAALSSTAEHM